MAQLLYDHKCDVNKMNNKAQTPLMVALEGGNFLLVEYFINQVKIDINCDVSQDGKTLLHYFANACDKYDLVQTLMKLVIQIIFVLLRHACLFLILASQRRFEENGSNV